jgi:3-oxoacyl-[acyl-carrier protein] reductase
MKLTGKTAVVTGATGNGIGRSIALTLGREGANVIVNHRNSKEEAEKIGLAIEELGGKFAVCQADIADKDACKKLVECTKESFGNPGIVIISPGGQWDPQPIDKLDSESSLQNIVHEISPIYNLFPLVLPGMYEKGFGRIIGISILRNPPSPSYAYDVGKIARTGALFRARDEAWQNSVTVNVIAPGPIDSPIESLEDAVALARHEDIWKKRKNITQQDIAEGVLFLCSEEGRFVSGSEMNFLWSD